jgi:hypothetical protein
MPRCRIRLKQREQASRAARKPRRCSTCGIIVPASSAASKTICISGHTCPMAVVRDAEWAIKPDVEMVDRAMGETSDNQSITPAPPNERNLPDEQEDSSSRGAVRGPEEPVLAVRRSGARSFESRGLCNKAR